MKKALKYTGIGFLSAVGLLFVSLYAIETIAQSNEPRLQKSDINTGHLLHLTNGYRVEHERKPLEQSQYLDKSARAKCQDMVEEDYWSHKKGGIEEIVNRYTKDWSELGENLAYGYSNTSDVFSRWQSSKSHNENLLSDKYTQVGFGVCKSPNFAGKGKQLIVVQHFTN